MRYSTLSSAVLLTALALPVSAQPTLETLPVGSRVRVQAPGLPLEGVQGTLSAPITDTIRLQPSRSPLLALLVDSLWRLDYRTHVAATAESKRRHGFIGAAFGAAAGAALMIGVQRAFPDCSDCRFGPTEEEREAWAREDRINTVLGALGGALIGRWYKARRHAARGGPGWARLPVPKDTLGGNRP